jgi:hypothetical protein
MKQLDSILEWSNETWNLSNISQPWRGAFLHTGKRTLLSVLHEVTSVNQIFFLPVLGTAAHNSAITIFLANHRWAAPESSSCNLDSFARGG